MDMQSYGKSQANGRLVWNSDNTNTQAQVAKSTPQAALKPAYTPKVQVHVGKPEWNKGQPKYTAPASFGVGRNNTAQSGAMEKQLKAESKMKTYR